MLGILYLAGLGIICGTLTALLLGLPWVWATLAAIVLIAGWLLGSKYYILGLLAEEVIEGDKLPKFKYLLPEVPVRFWYVDTAKPLLSSLGGCDVLVSKGFLEGGWGEHTALLRYVLKCGCGVRGQLLARLVCGVAVGRRFENLLGRYINFRGRGGPVDLLHNWIGWMIGCLLFALRIYRNCWYEWDRELKVEDGVESLIKYASSMLHVGAESSWLGALSLLSPVAWSDLHAESRLADLSKVSVEDVWRWSVHRMPIQGVWDVRPPLCRRIALLRENRVPELKARAFWAPFIAVLILAGGCYVGYLQGFYAIVPLMACGGWWVGILRRYPLWGRVYTELRAICEDGFAGWYAKRVLVEGRLVRADNSVDGRWWLYDDSGARVLLQGGVNDGPELSSEKVRVSGWLWAYPPVLVVSCIRTAKRCVRYFPVGLSLAPALLVGGISTVWLLFQWLQI